MNADTKFDSYFHDRIDYPRPAVEPLIPGVMFAYISSTFLDGWINYVGKVRRAYLVTRYRQHEENVAALAEWHAEPPFHSDLSDLDDDVHLIAKDEGDKWWYFWFDRDVSDCNIGILGTADSDEDVIAAFDAHITKRHGHESPDIYGENGSNTASPALLIDPSSIRGWVKG